MSNKCEEYMGVLWKELCDSFKLFEENPTSATLHDIKSLSESMFYLKEISEPDDKEWESREGGRSSDKSYRNIRAYMEAAANREMAEQRMRNRSMDNNYDSRSTDRGRMSNAGDYRMDNGGDYRMDNRSGNYRMRNGSGEYYGEFRGDYGTIRNAAHSSKPLDDKGMKDWANRMENSDGTNGPHWTKEQTTGVAKKIGVKWDEITEMQFWLTMNMMYSDYCETAKKFGVNNPEFYAHLACDFLMDEDAEGGPEGKLRNYHEYIAG